ncbi:GIY-YIG nuclease family protein [Paenibacillus elgii]|uniref:GIY-YIG nuclease family protein n=1 Tax=Paenibacillus elgii TaxID=189691 RepID=UPI0013D35459|nr:GIY-YIG nuclease family protein [Paenibacillus elgii]
MQVNLSGTVKFSLASMGNVPIDSGVYLIHDLRGTLYIGKSTNLQRRFEQHWYKSHNIGLNKALLQPVGPVHFSWIRHPNPMDLEKSLVTFIRPFCNQIKFKNTKE